MSRAYKSAARRHSGKPLSFTLDGVTFTCVTEISVLDFSELASWSDLDASSPEGLAALKHFFTMLLGPVEFRRFRQHCAAHRTDDDTIVQIMGDLAEDFLGRPTSAPQPSPSTPSATGSGSTAPGSHVVVNLGSGKRVTVDAASPDLSAVGDVQQVS
jgi:hypothetical protein